MSESALLMRDVSQYFDLLEKTIGSSLVVSAEIEFDRRDHAHGLIEGVLYFADGSRLEFTERVLIEKSRPVKRNYRYQYIRQGTAIFRYDNAAHHPHVATFPHHKHVGNKMIPAIEPTLKQVLDEVDELVLEMKDSPPSPHKRRRQRKPQR